MPPGYVVKRVLLLVLVLLGVSMLVFLMLRLIPGDAARLLLGEFASPAELSRLRTQLGLDQSVMAQ